MPRLSKIGAAALAAFGWTSGSAVTASYLVIAGGGAGAQAIGGGGGAGGYQTGTTSLNPTLSYTVTVGAGGAGIPETAGGISGNDGSNSVFNAITSIGGGGGGAYAVGRAGGSGGGGGISNSAGGAGTAGQGNNGGTSNNSYPQASGGGGGAGAVGANASGANAGAGGNGLASSISGTSVTYAGGGGGSYNADGSGSVGAGGSGGGTAGGNAVASTSAAANTGSGSGGGGYYSLAGGNANKGSGNGGSGIVIISYVGAQQFGGGVVTSSGGNTIHTFTTSGTLSPLSSLTVSALIVAGGGGGAGGNTAFQGGGGGGGGLQTPTGLTIDTNSIYVVTVGAGGANGSSASGTNGANSTFSIFSTASVGGGYGANRATTGGTGGSGGGGGDQGGSGSAGAGGSGTVGQGNNGGNGASGTAFGGAGGGGGAGAVGGNASTYSGGNGGNGSASSISGSSVTYAGGGGGAANTSLGGTAGSGGSGGGGAGAGPSTAGSGTANTGGGGGGSTNTAGSGGSGVVIISYPGSTQQMAGGTVTVAGGNVIHTFTSSGYLTPIVLTTNSLRYRSSASAYLNRTPTTAGNRKTWTFSAWIKRGSLGSVGTVFHCYDGSSSRRSVIQFNSNNTIGWDQGGSATSGLIDTVAVYRDPSAWYHLVCVADYTNSTAANRGLIYINGVLQTVTTTDDFDNDDGLINSTNAHQIGSQDGSGNFFDGYLADVNFIDGQALTPNSFGSFNGLGVWQPIRYGGSYGTNGFYLPFSNTTSTTTLGYDFSPNGNNWTTNNISLTAGSTYDSMTDVPTLTSATVANYAVLNPLNTTITGSMTLSYANMQMTTSTANRSRVSTVVISSGKWYAEAVFSTSSGNLSGCMLGLVLAADVDNVVGTYIGDTANSYGYNQTGNKYNNSSGSSYGASYTSGDVIGIAFDADAGSITFYKNNSSQGTAFTGLSTSSSWTIGVSGGLSDTSADIVVDINFGQRPFAYTPPSGFVALNTFNLPTPTIGATAATTANKYFDSVIWTGDQTNKQIPLNFTADFVWAKRRSGGDSHRLYDVIRGINKDLQSNATDAEQTNDFGLDFDNGNYLAIDGTKYFGGGGGSGTTFVAWNWEANGTGVTNTAGSITSTVSANTTAGFSIVTYTGTGSTGTVGHGLGVAPKMIISKNRSAAEEWRVGHIGLTNMASWHINLNGTGAQSNSGAAIWNNTAPTSTIFGVGTDTSVSGNGNLIVAYCFSEVAGYSAFGKYTGNSSSNGPFVFTGFRPRWIMVKPTNVSGEYWQIIDTSRNPYNASPANMLSANLSNAEANIASQTTDILSNGFKFRGTGGGTNGGGTTYIYMAFAESPFKYANAR